MQSQQATCNSVANTIRRPVEPLPSRAAGCKPGKAAQKQEVHTMTNNTIIADTLAATLTAAQIHAIAAAVKTPAQIAEIAAGLDVRNASGQPIDATPAAERMIAAQSVHTYNEWKRQGLQVKAGEKALFSCHLWRWTDKPSKARQQEAAQAAADGQDGPAADEHYYKTTAYLFSALQVSKPQPVHVKTPEEIAARNAELAAARKARRAAATTAAPAVPAASPTTAPSKPAVVAIVEHHALHDDAEPVQLDFATLAAQVLA